MFSEVEEYETKYDNQIPEEDLEVLHNRGYDINELIVKGMNGNVFRGVCNEYAIKRYMRDNTTEVKVIFDPKLNIQYIDVSVEDRECVVKCVSAQYIDYNEVKHLIELSHENIADMYEVIETNGQNVYIISEYIESGDFNQFCDTLDEFQSLDMIRQLVEGMAYLHRRELLHNDVHPGNIMLTTKSGHSVWKFIDLGSVVKTNSNNPKRFASDMRGLGYILSAIIDITEFTDNTLKDQVLEVIDRMIDSEYYSHMYEVIQDLCLISVLIFIAQPMDENCFLI